LAQFRTTADLLDSILRRSGEVTDGTSDLEADALEYLNRVHHSIIAGGNEFDVEVDEPWIWARAKRPMVLELQPAYSTGTVSLTLGSEIGAFLSAPAYSVEGWFLRMEGRNAIYRIAEHTAGATAFQIDGAYAEATGATQTFKAFKLDYVIEPSYLIVDAGNNKIQFEEAALTPLTATLASGSYTPADLAVEIKTKLDVAGANTYTVSYNSLSKKFTLLSDLGAGIFSLLFVTGSLTSTSAHILLGYDDLDYTGAASYEGVYRLNGVSRMIEPFRIYGLVGDLSRYGSIDSIDPITMQKRFPLTRAEEGTPQRFAKIAEDSEGNISVRFDKYPKNKTRIEIEYIPVPRDLQDNTVSRPIFPRKYTEILEYGAAFYILIDKEDSKSTGFAQLSKSKLSAMRHQNRSELERTSQDFGQITPRPDLINGYGSRRLRYGVPEEN